MNTTPSDGLDVLSRRSVPANADGLPAHDDEPVAAHMFDTTPENHAATYRNIDRQPDPTRVIPTDRSRTKALPRNGGSLSGPALGPDGTEHTLEEHVANSWTAGLLFLNDGAVVHEQYEMGKAGGSRSRALWHPGQHAMGTAAMGGPRKAGDCPSMKQSGGAISGETTVSLMLAACPEDCQATCSLRRAAANLAAGRNGPKDSLTRCEAETFLSLAPGHQVVVLDNETGEVRRGSVDMPFSQQGFVWVATDLGERKLYDIAVHTVWRPNTRQFCSRERQEPGDT